MQPIFLVLFICCQFWDSLRSLWLSHYCLLDHRRKQMEYGKDLQAQIDEKRRREEKLKQEDKEDGERRQKGKLTPFYSLVQLIKIIWFVYFLNSTFVPWHHVINFLFSVNVRYYTESAKVLQHQVEQKRELEEERNKIERTVHDQVEPGRWNHHNNTIHWYRILIRKNLSH